MKPQVRSLLDARRERQHVIRIFRKRLETFSFPRVQMAFIVALTGGAGLMASYLMLAAGWDGMGTRYPAALALAYGVFLFLLWVWLRTRAEDWNGGDLGDLPANIDLPEIGSAPFRSGSGGDFGGGGAEASFDGPASPALDLDKSHEMPSLADAGGDVGGGIDGDLPILVILLALGMALASLYVVWSAPVLFAELLLDGALSYSLFRRLRRPERFHWFETALKRTVWPFVLTAIFLCVMGFAMQVYAPEARSLGEVLQHAASAN
jgi:hypothetical protein